VPKEVAQAKTAFVFAGGGNFGAIQGWHAALARAPRHCSGYGLSVRALAHWTRPTMLAIPRLKESDGGDDLAWIVPARRLSVHMENHDRVHCTVAIFLWRRTGCANSSWQGA